MAGEVQQWPEDFFDRDLTEESHEQHHVTYRHHMSVLIGSGQPEARFMRPRRNKESEPELLKKDSQSTALQRL